MDAAMFLMASFFVLLILSPTTTGAGSECKMYVSSFHGVNDKSCWTGGYQTPCASFDLALQATTHGNCSSSSIIYLYPGDYTLDLDTTTTREKHNNVKDVSIRVLESPSLLENECHLDMDVEVLYYMLKCPPICGLRFTASVTDCNGATLEWKNDLYVCITTPNNLFCHNVSSHCMCGGQNCEGKLYELVSFPIFATDANPIEVILNVSTLGPTVASTNVTVNVTSECLEPYNLTNGVCEPRYYTKCSNNQDYCPLVAAECLYFYYYPSAECLNGACYQLNSTPKQWLCANCPSGKGVSFNKINICVQCNNPLKNILIFIGIEILPITIMVLIIIILNVQLTNGSINGLVFYSQIIFFIYSDYVLILSTKSNYQLLVSPCNIFSLDFTLFLVNSLICIVPNMSPLGAISFWYVIGFYPLFLLLLIYVWIVLYDKGFRCVVCITRPFHRCMARFWSITGIEPSLVHSIASIYILCFTQIAGVSFNILRFCLTYNNNLNINGSYFFYDAKMEYFHGVHAVAGSVAILVLIVVIIIPTLYIQFYRFKWFHKLLGILHLRKQLLISLGDVFTGPYKNGSDNTFDYRFFAGLYLLARIIIMSSIFLSGINNAEVPLLRLKYYYISIAMPIQGCCVLLLGIMVLLFSPFKKTIHSFSEVAMFIMEIAFFCTLFVLNTYTYVDYTIIDEGNLKLPGLMITSFNCLLFGIILPSYILYQLVKMMSNCYYYWKQHNHTVRDQEEISFIDDDDWIADRMKNPQEYAEKHVTVRLDYSLPTDPNTSTTIPPSYGSINNK